MSVEKDGGVEVVEACCRAGAFGRLRGTSLEFQSKFKKVGGRGGVGLEWGRN